MIGVACGKRGIGKTEETKKTIRKYLTGGKKGKPRKVLIFDVNDEFMDVQGLWLSDVKAFSRHPRIQVRRIRPFNADGSKMVLNDIREALFEILQNFRGGMLLIEDINRYLTHNLPMDIVGAICTNRHNDLDIIIHYQALGKMPPTLWENCNWIRFHKNQSGIVRHEEKMQEHFEMMLLAETLVNMNYGAGNKYFFCYCVLDNRTIMGDFTAAQAQAAVNQYLSQNYKKAVKPLMDHVDPNTGQPLYADRSQAINHVKSRLLQDYFPVTQSDPEKVVEKKGSPRKRKSK